VCFVTKFNPAHLASRLDCLVFPALVTAESFVLSVAGFVPLILKFVSAFQAFSGEPAVPAILTHPGVEAVDCVAKSVAAIFADGGYGSSVDRS
jgi:hypothetical protein